MTDSHVCPKCKGTMHSGFVANAAHGQMLQSSWSPGEPESRRYIGGVKVKRDEQVPMTAWRCTDCGYVEFYAS